MGDFTSDLSLLLSQFAELKFDVSAACPNSEMILLSLSPSRNFSVSPKFPLQESPSPKVWPTHMLRPEYI